MWCLVASVTYNDVDQVFCTAGLAVRLFIHLDGAFNHVITLSFRSLQEDPRQFLPCEFLRFENIGEVKLAVEPVRSHWGHMTVLSMSNSRQVNLWDERIKKDNNCSIIISLWTIITSCISKEIQVSQWYKCHSCKSVCCDVIIGWPEHPKNPRFETHCISYRRNTHQRHFSR